MPGLPDWLSCSASFQLPEKAASQEFRVKSRDAMRDAGLESGFPAVDRQAWTQGWNVQVEAVGDGRAVLKYLAPSVYRFAISNNRIKAVNDAHGEQRAELPHDRPQPHFGYSSV